MESVDANSEVENDAEMKLLRDKFRLSAISIIESQAKQNGMEVSKVVVTCVADLAFKYTERLARDLHLFAQHANRKSVNMEDVILCGHRNEHVSGMLMKISLELKAEDVMVSLTKERKGGKRNERIYNNELKTGHEGKGERFTWRRCHPRRWICTLDRHTRMGQYLWSCTANAMT
ncbi:hypothetical protein JHK87_010705 [Glycine soja]|nr:hypothetical protein JHK87_010705 [Glycine soja]